MGFQLIGFDSFCIEVGSARYKFVCKRIKIGSFYIEVGSFYIGFDSFYIEAGSFYIDLDSFIPGFVSNVSLMIKLLSSDVYYRY